MLIVLDFLLKEKKIILKYSSDKEIVLYIHYFPRYQVIYDNIQILQLKPIFIVSYVYF